MRLVCTSGAEGWQRPGMPVSRDACGLKVVSTAKVTLEYATTGANVICPLTQD